MTPLVEKEIKLDSKKRATLSGAEYEHYHMVVYDNGTIVLEPRMMVAPPELSENTLSMIDRSMASVKQGVAGDSIDFSRYRNLIDKDDV